MDIESLEKSNDRDIDHLGDRVGLLKSLTKTIKGEVDSHNSVLDNLANDMGGTHGSLAGAANRFKKVFDDSQNKRMLLIVVGTVGVLFFLYVFFKR
jgi:hypothetical protein